MPRQSHNGYWTSPQSPQTTTPGAGEIPKGKIWPGGYFDSMEHWQAVHLQVFRQGRHLSKNYGFLDSVFWPTNTPKPLDPKFGGYIDGRKTTAFKLPNLTGVTYSDLVWMKGRWHPTIPNYWQLENQVPFSTQLSSSTVSLEQKHVGRFLPIFPAGTTESKSLILSSSSNLQPLETRTNRADTVYGPYVISKKPVDLQTGQIIEFWWRAKGKNGCGFVFTVYLTGIVSGPAQRSQQQSLLSVFGHKDQANDQQRKISADVEDGNRDIPELTKNAELRDLNEVEFEVGRAPVAVPNGKYNIVIVLGSWDTSKNLTIGAEAEIAAIRIL